MQSWVPVHTTGAHDTLVYRLAQMLVKLNQGERLGRYKVTSQAIPIQSSEAAPLLRVVAFIRPQGDADDMLLRAVQTDDVIRVRGIV